MFSDYILLSGQKKPGSGFSHNLSGLPFRHFFVKELSLFDHFQIFPRTFTIINNTKPYLFNIYFVSASFSRISQHLKKNPDQLEYHINIPDPDNVMKKIENLFVFSPVHLVKSDLFFIQTLGNELGSFNLYSIISNFISDNHGVPFRLDGGAFKSFIFSKKISIISNGISYDCSYFGSTSSAILKECFEVNPDVTTFSFNIDGSFEQIQKLFNFETVFLTHENCEFFQRVCDDLEIDCFREEIQQFVALLDETFDKIDSMTWIQPVKDLCNTLYNLQTLTVPRVARQLVETEWVHGEENIRELNAYILQAIRTDLRLHPYLIDLLIELEKESDETNDLKLFLPLFKEQLFQTFLTNLHYGAFLYKLTERNIIPFSLIQEYADNTNQKSTYNISDLFYPEFYGAKSFFYSSDLTLSTNEYKELRKNFFPINMLLQLILDDDIDQLQLTISRDSVPIHEPVKLISFFARNSRDLNPKISLIDFAAECGSINCFNYLLLNHLDLSYDSFTSAVRGGNIEIIRKVHDRLIETNGPDYRGKKSFNYSACLEIAILNHRNNIVEWLLDQYESNPFNTLYIACSSSGNIEATILLFQRGIPFPEESQVFPHMIQNGFYRLVRFFTEIFPGVIPSSIYMDPKIMINSHSLSIFKLFREAVVPKMLYYAIECNNLYFVDYLVNNTNLLLPSKENYYSLYLSSLQPSSPEMFNYLIQKVPIESAREFFDWKDYFSLLSAACSHSILTAVEILTPIVLEKNQNFDFTHLFSKAMSSNSVEICDFFAEKKVALNIDELLHKNVQYILLHHEILEVLFKAIDPALQPRYSLQFFKACIQSQQYKNIQSLLKMKANLHPSIALYLRQPFLNSPFVNSIIKQDKEVINGFIDYFGQELPEQIKSIDLGLKNLLNRLCRESTSIDASAIEKFFEITDIFYHYSYKGATFLSRAIKESNVSFVSMYLTHLKDKSVFESTATDSPIVLAIRSGDPLIIQAFTPYLSNNHDILKQQINLGLDLYLKDCYEKRLEAKILIPNEQFISLLTEIIDPICTEDGIMTVDLNRIFCQSNFLTLANGCQNESFINFYFEYFGKDHQFDTKSSLTSAFSLVISQNDLYLTKRFIQFYGEKIVEQNEVILLGLQNLLENAYKRYLEIISAIHDGISLLLCYRTQDDLSSTLHQFDYTILPSLFNYIGERKSEENKTTFFGMVGNAVSLNKTPYHVTTGISDSFLNCLFRSSSIDVNCLKYKNESFLTIAIRTNDDQLVSVCLNSSKDRSVFKEISDNSPICLAIQSQNIKIVNLFISFLSDDIVNYKDQINYGLQLLLKTLCENVKKNSEANPRFSNHQYFNTHIETACLKALAAVVDIDLNCSYENMSFFTIAIQHFNDEFISFYLNYFKDKSPLINKSLTIAIQNYNLEAVKQIVRFLGDEIEHHKDDIQLGLNFLLQDLLSYRSINQIPNPNDQGTPYQLSKYFNVRVNESIPNNRYQLLVPMLTYLSTISKFDLNFYYQEKTFLIRAIELNDIELVKCLLRIGVDVNLCNLDNGDSPLMTAYSQKHIPIIELLLNCPETNCNLMNYQNETALSYALSMNILHCMTVLIERTNKDLLDYPFYLSSNEIAGMLISIPELNVNYVRISSCKTSSLLNAINKQQFDKAALIIGHPNFDPIQSCASKAIFRCIEISCYSLFEQLLPFVDINSVNESGKSLFIYSCEKSFIQGLQRIASDDKFDHKNQILTAIQRSLDGMFAFKLDLVKLLVEIDEQKYHSIHFDQLLPNGKSFFTIISHDSSKNQHSDLIQFINILIQKGLDINKPDRFGVYPLQHAILLKNYEIVKCLLETEKIDYSVKINMKQMINGTYLHLAIYSSFDILKLLYETKAIDASAVDGYGDSPLMIVQRHFDNEKAKQSKKGKLDNNWLTTSSDELQLTSNLEQLESMINLLSGKPIEPNKKKRKLVFG